ncbi:MAG TPA: MFS transporter [Mycobacteriales bacterium]|nr:MFS transporter [Mycobacteriales bacterium]
MAIERDDTAVAAALPARYAGLAVVALALGTFSFVTTETLPIGLLPQIAADLGVSLSAAGLLVSGYALVVLVMSVPLTMLLRRVPRRYLLAGVFTVFAAATGLSATAATYPMLLLARMAIALTHSVFWSVVAATAVGLHPPRHRGRVLASLYSGGSLGVVLGTPAGTWLGQHAGWRVAFWVMSVLAVVTLTAIVVLLPTARPEQNPAAAGSSPDRRRYLVLIVAMCLVVTGLFTLQTYIAPFLTEVSGFPVEAVSLLLLLGGSASLAGAMVSGWLVARRPEVVVVGPVVLLALALLALYAFGTMRPATVALLAVIGLGFAIMVTGVQHWIFEVAPGSSDVATAGSSAAFNFGIGSGALIGGLLLPSTGVRSTALVGGLLAVTAVAVLLAGPMAALPARAPH